MVQLIGFVAGTITTLAFVPQVVKTWRTRSTGDLSLGMLTAFACGVTLWVAYGLLKGELPIVAANAATLALTLVLIALKLQNPSIPRQRQPPNASP